MSESRSQRWRRRLASVEAAAIAGIICATGWSFGVRGLLAAPGIGASDAEIARFYNDPGAGLNALLLLQVIVIAGTSALAAPSVLVEAGGKAVDPGAASMARALAVTLLSVFAPRIATLVMFSTAALSRKTKALPRWLISVTYLAGILEFVNVTVARPTIYIFPAWIGLVSIVLLIRDRPAHLQPLHHEVAA